MKFSYMHLNFKESLACPYAFGFEEESQLANRISAVVKQEGLYIRGMAIVPNARGKRIGVTLLQQAESFGLERGIRRLFLSTTPFLFRAISLYENYGFTKSPSGPHDLCGTPLFTMEKSVEGLTRNRAAPAEQIHNGT